MAALIYDALDLAAVIGSAIGYPVLIVLCVVAVWVFRMIQRTPEGYQITLKVGQAKAILVGLALAGVCYVIDISDRFGVIDWLKLRTPLTLVEDRTFYNTTVPVDGYSYHHDTFDHVTFIYNGIGKYEFINNNLGSFTLSSHNPQILQELYFLSGFGELVHPLHVNGEAIPPYGDHPKLNCVHPQ